MDGVSVSISTSTIIEKRVAITWDRTVGYKSGKSGLQSIENVGYKISCATTRSFTSTIDCLHNGTHHSHDSKTAILSFSRYDQPYYAKIEVVRNIEGHEEIDGKYYTTEEFCASEYLEHKAIIPTLMSF